MCYRQGNFQRGYDIIQYILEDKKHTLRGAARELGIAEVTARADFYRVYCDARDGQCHEPEKTLKLFVKAYKRLHPGCMKK